MKLKITVWSIKNDNGAIVFNHIEDGWSDSEYPLPIKSKYKNQEAWKKSKWDKKYANLINDIVVYG